MNLQVSRFHSRMNLGIVFALMSFSPMLSKAVRAQEQTPASTPQLQQHPLNALQNSQPGDADQYQLGGGDELTITVIGRPELSGAHTIGPDGRISISSVGSVEVGGLTRDAASKTITDALKAYYTNPAVDVQVTKYGSNRILLLGDVEKPGVMYFDGTPTLLEVIGRGGQLVGSDKGLRMPSSCIIYRGNNQITNVNLKDVLRSGDVRLNRNDIVYVPGDNERLVSVLGEVKNPGAVPIKETSTLVSLIADAGGLTEQAGNPMIQIINPKTGVIQQVKFNDLLKLRAKDSTLDIGDIIYVPKSGIAKVGFVMQQLAPALQIGSILGVIDR